MTRPIESKNLVALSKPDENTQIVSPMKPGILLTPGTVRGKRKEVKFGAQVVDNEGKKPSRTGVPTNCPGKFPSPFTPRAVEPAENKRSNPKEEKPIAKAVQPKTKVTEALFEAKSTKTSPTGKGKAKPRARDDADITIDMMEPRSESGRYWKDQYLSYSRKSEEETKKLIAKQKMAKDYARKKDEEATALRGLLETERKSRHGRVKSLERQNKELRELLRVQMGDNFQSSLEAALLRQHAEKGSTAEEPTITRSTIVRADTPTETASTTTGKTKDSANTKSLRSKVSTAPGPTEIWEDAADINEEYSRKIDLSSFSLGAPLSQPRREKPRPVRAHRDGGRLMRKPASIGRQDPVLIPKTEARTPTPPRSTRCDVDPFISLYKLSPAREGSSGPFPESLLKSTTGQVASSSPFPETTPTPQASRTTKPTQSVRRTLGERNPNIIVISPAPQLLSSSETEIISSFAKSQNSPKGALAAPPTPKFDPSSFLDTFDPTAQDFTQFDASAPFEALSMQADQAVTPEPASRREKSHQSSTPTPVPSSKKHYRSYAQSVASISADRKAQAKARLEERRRARLKTTENTKP